MQPLVNMTAQAVRGFHPAAFTGCQEPESEDASRKERWRVCLKTSHSQASVCPVELPIGMPYSTAQAHAPQPSAVVPSGLERFGTESRWRCAATDQPVERKRAPSLLVKGTSDLPPEDALLGLGVGGGREAVPGGGAAQLGAHGLDAAEDAVLALLDGLAAALEPELQAADIAQPVSDVRRREERRPDGRHGGVRKQRWERAIRV
eukprot:6067235-Pleurochrysis_carterae.AAC.2